MSVPLPPVSSSSSASASSSSLYNTEMIRAHFHLRVSPSRIAQERGGREMLERCCAAYGFSSLEVWYQLAVIGWLQTHKFMSSALTEFARAAGITKNIVSRRFSMTDALAFLMLDDPTTTEDARTSMEKLFGYTFFPGRSERLFTNLMGDVVPRLELMHSRAIAAVAAAATAQAGADTEKKDAGYKYPQDDLAACARFFAAYFAARLKPPSRRNSAAAAAGSSSSSSSSKKSAAEANAAADQGGYVMMLKRPRRFQVEFCVDGSLITVKR